MSPLQSALDEYLAGRRALGHKLRLSGRLLQRFVEFADHAGATCITTELAVEWATQPADAKPAQWANRLGMVRRFAQYCSAIDPRTAVPPPDLLPHRYRRPAPYVYRDDEIARLLEAAARLPPGKPGRVALRRPGAAWAYPATHDPALRPLGAADPAGRRRSCFSGDPRSCGERSSRDEPGDPQGVTPDLPTLYLRKPKALKPPLQTAADRKFPWPQSIAVWPHPSQYLRQTDAVMACAPDVCHIGLTGFASLPCPLLLRWQLDCDRHVVGGPQRKGTYRVSCVISEYSVKLNCSAIVWGE